MKYLFVALALAFSVQATAFETRYLKVKKGLLTLRMGVFKAKGPARGDILYLPGLGDRLDNHGPLFSSWTEQGFRVVSFDYPSHGGTYGPMNHLDFYNFNALMGLAEKVETATREETGRPLLLAGWSTGGLLATRLVQTSRLERKPQGLILFSPGVSVYALIGEMGVITQRTLTSNPSPPHAGPIRPISPLPYPAFSAALLTNAALSRSQALAPIPTLLMMGGDETDRYVKVPQLRNWVQDQRGRQASDLKAVQCQGARHEIDNEPGSVGPTVRNLSARFASAVLDGKGFLTGLSPTGVCQAF